MKCCNACIFESDVSQRVEEAWETFNTSLSVCHYETGNHLSETERLMWGTLVLSARFLLPAIFKTTHSYSDGWP